MATFRFSIIGTSNPDATGRCRPELYTVKATNDVFGHLVFVLDDPSSSQEHGIYGVFDVPQNYVGTAVVTPVWTSTATSGNCRMRFSYRAVGGDNTESLDQATFQEQVAVTDAAPSSANNRLTPTISLTSSNIAAGDTVEFYFTRLDDSGTDTMAAAATLHDLLFSFSDV